MQKIECGDNMNEKKAHHLSFNISKLYSIILTLFLLTACDSCKTNGTATTVGKPTEGVVIPNEFDVKKDLDNAWATLTDLNQFVSLTDPDWKTIIAQGLVTTDNLGEAQLCPHSSINANNECPPTEACHIYVFWDSSLKYSSCSESSTSVLCSYDGTQAFRNCNFSIQTLSADIEGLGTWFSVTYLRDTQITLVIVTEGKVKVTPVQVLDITINQSPTFVPTEEESIPPFIDIHISKRSMGEPQTSTDNLIPGQIQVYYTAPDAILKIMGLTDLPMKQWLDIEGLNLLRKELRLREPNLESWLQVVWQKIPEEFTPPTLEPLSATKPALIITGYDALANENFAKALSYSLEWEALIKGFLREDVPVVFNGLSKFKGQVNILTDMRSMKYERNIAYELFKETGYDQVNLTLVVPPDRAVQNITKIIQSSLTEYGLHVEVAVVPEIELNQKAQLFLDQGSQVLVIKFEEYYY
jgi:hypothetical protein